MSQTLDFIDFDLYPVNINLKPISNKPQFNLEPKLAKMKAEENTMAENEDKGGILENVSGLGQIIIGEIEKIAGIVNADPLAQAEGEYNVEVGTIREEIEEDLEAENKDEHPAGGS